MADAGNKCIEALLQVKRQEYQNYVAGARASILKACSRHRYECIKTILQTGGKYRVASIADLGDKCIEAMWQMQRTNVLRSYCGHRGGFLRAGTQISILRPYGYVADAKSGLLRLY